MAIEPAPPMLIGYESGSRPSSFADSEYPRTGQSLSIKSQIKRSFSLPTRSGKPVEHKFSSPFPSPAPQISEVEKFVKFVAWPLFCATVGSVGGKVFFDIRADVETRHSELPMDANGVSCANGLKNRTGELRTRVKSVKFAGFPTWSRSVKPSQSSLTP